MKKVLIPTKLDAIAAELLKERNFTVVQDASELQNVIANNRDASVLIVRSEKITEAVIDELPNLKLIVRAGAGYDNIDSKYARRKGIAVMNTPGANANAVAEEVVAMILSAYRHVVEADISTRAGGWEKNKFMGRELTGKTVGIVGLGNIGQLVAKRISGFDCKILAYDPVVSAGFAQHLGVELVPLDKLFARADIVTLHIPETEATRGLVNRELMASLKDGAVIVNCARAGIINEADLREIKQTKKMIFCNDVYPKDAPGEKSVADIADLMLPHLGASTHEANWTAAKRSAEQTIAYFEKGITTCVVNKAVPDDLNPLYQDLASTLAKFAYVFLGGQSVHQIEVTLYGELDKFFDFMIAPVTNGLFPEFDPYQDACDAETFLKERGITVIKRIPDNRKGYGQSITLDLLQGDAGNLKRVSLRGTLAEGKMMIARIDGYRNLYLEPSGNNLFVEYNDEPGVLGRLASLLGSNNINILDVRAPIDIKRARALAVLKTNLPIPPNMSGSIRMLVKDGRVAIVNA